MRKLESSIGRFENFVISLERILVKDFTNNRLVKFILTDVIIPPTPLKVVILGIALSMVTTLAFDFLPPNNSQDYSINALIELDTTPNLNNTFSFPKKEFTDNRDQQKYPMVKINNRWWMGKNLNFETSESNCYKDQNQCSDLGRLYNWEDAKTACPKNWRLPSQQEWSEMLISVFGKDATCNECYTDLIADGSSGFEGKLGGFKSSNGRSYFMENNYGYYWTNTVVDSLNVEYFVFSQPKKFVNKSVGLKDSGFSCRCILEEGKEPTDTSSFATITPPVLVPVLPVFSTGFFTDYRDGQSYPTIDINGTTWLAQNLNYNNPESYCYKDDEKNCIDQGRLYTWESAQTACPKGWELPSQNEWKKVLQTLRDTFYCKSCFEDFTLGGKSGFSATLSGLRRGEDGKFYDINRNGHYWSNTAKEDKRTSVYVIQSETSEIKINTRNNSPENAISCRCIKSKKPIFKLGLLTDERDNQTYATVRIDGKWWMAENLNFSTKNSFYYDDEIEKNGLLYTWKSAQDACPKGWHLPSDDEWLEMTRYCGQSLIAQRKEDTIDNGEQTFEFLLEGGQSNFNAVLGGVREKGKRNKGEYNFLDNLGYYWTSTKNDNKEAWFYGFSNLPEEGGLTRSTENREWAFSCRCVKN